MIFILTASTAVPFTATVSSFSRIALRVNSVRSVGMSIQKSNCSISDVIKPGSIRYDVN
ncbi:hypothetical protein [Breznakiella homolactica]|uniref:Uncharacterized protein n=1 Tax=Breznakiella homolactica TaxID=2798577 RepID=A0A7T7XR96_9SPIR|nr:hypothetical protein [Breznakiella homolactica]QQO10948.1 hypothetical protein JFL75_08530 [Breznakiella homolactica]